MRGHRDIAMACLPAIVLAVGDVWLCVFLSHGVALMGETLKILDHYGADLSRWNNAECFMMSDAKRPSLAPARPYV